VQAQRHACAKLVQQACCRAAQAAIFDLQSYQPVLGAKIGGRGAVTTASRPQ
jgi:hypothetical protein